MCDRDFKGIDSLGGGCSERSSIGPILLGLKAEVVFGTLLVMRDRSVMLAGILALMVAILSLLQGFGHFEITTPPNTVFLITGMLAAVSGARLLAPGSALAASRRVAAVWWLVPLGRQAGAMVVVVPVAMATALALGLASEGWHWACVTVPVYSAAVASLGLLFSPIIGTSAASAMGVATVWCGMLSPGSVGQILERWPFLRISSVFAWHVLPLPWRAHAAVEMHSVSNLLLLLGWAASGVVAAGFVAGSVRSFGLPRRGGAR